MARDALYMWLEHPWLGVGIGDFETAYPRYHSFPTDMWVDHAQNDYVEAAAETGLVGALLILAAVALFLYLAFRNVIHLVGSNAGWVRLGAAIGCCGLLVHSFGDFNLHIPANAAWFAVLAGIATSEQSGAGSLPRPVGVPPGALVDLGLSELCPARPEPSEAQKAFTPFCLRVLAFS